MGAEKKDKSDAASYDNDHRMNGTDEGPLVAISPKGMGNCVIRSNCDMARTWEIK